MIQRWGLEERKCGGGGVTGNSCGDSGVGLLSGTSFSSGGMADQEPPQTKCPNANPILPLANPHPLKKHITEQFRACQRQFLTRGHVQVEE
jgi:hypothetical protein